MEKVLAYDMGGTKVEVGVVSSKGKIISSRRELVEFEGGKNHVIKQLIELGQEYLKEHKGIKRVGFASAGPLHPQKGLLLNPTNFSYQGKTWGKVPLVSLMEKGLKKKVILENDAAAAVGAEAWLGAAKGVKNVLMLTLGTGLGTGIIVDGKLIRAGEGLHTEAGHMIVNYLEKVQRCGCGNFGCAEAYLSGTGFQRWAREGIGRHDLNNSQIEKLARDGDKEALRMFTRYGHILANVIHNFVVMFAPKVIVLSGSFAAATDLFIPSTQDHLKLLLKKKNEGIDMMPKLRISKLNNHAGLLGAAYLALQS